MGRLGDHLSSRKIGTIHKRLCDHQKSTKFLRAQSVRSSVVRKHVASGSTPNDADYGDREQYKPGQFGDAGHAQCGHLGGVHATGGIELVEA